MTTMPFLWPCSTYRCAAAISSSGYRPSMTGFKLPDSASSASSARSLADNRFVFNPEVFLFPTASRLLGDRNACRLLLSWQ